MPADKISEEEKDIRGKIIADVNTFVPTSISDYIEDHEENHEAIFQLVVTLKHWTNPEGAYECALSANDLKEYFTDLQKIVHNPKLILPNATLTENNKQFAREILHIKLNKEADELILRFHFEERITAMMNSSKKAELWWKNKNEDEKAAIQRKYQSLNAAQLKKIKKQTHSNIINVENIDPFPYYLMCNDIARINLMILEDSIRATAYVGRALVDGLGTLARGMGGRSGGGNGGGGSSGGSTDEGMLYVIGIAGFIALISSGLVAGAYALKKVYNSLKNLTEQKKMLRSLFRLSSIGIGGYYGAVEFAALGALFGSFVPGIGTATGALIGAIFGTGIGAGLGALISKYIAKALSYIAYEHENNPSNPEKYKLTEAEIAHLKREHLDVKTINRMLRAARKEKNNVGIMGSFPETNERQHKDLWNVRIKQIKSGKIDKLEIAGRIYNARFNELGKPYFSEEDSTTMIHHHLDMIQKSLIPIPDDKLLQNKEIDLNWQIEPQPSAPPSHSLTF